tara:strand:- start:373 stop:693 length:321 start_codon:yes stop_codon:yes gene_type:complete
MEEAADLSIAKRIERNHARSDRAIAKSQREVDGDADMVNDPPHYHIAGIEVVYILEEMGPYYDGNEGFHVLTAVQYILRAHKKGGWEDIEKAKWHLDRAIANRFDD